MELSRKAGSPRGPSKNCCQLENIRCVSARDGLGAR
jgi:hypothetical protein